ncbi:MAG: hypothetical protein ACRD2W_20075 [Acidimicrobiales bacterium]
MNDVQETGKRPHRGRRVGVVVLLLMACTVAAAAPSSAAVRLEHGGQVPFYARITTIGTPDQIFRDGQWVAIVFYRPAECVPDDFDLLTFFDFPGPSGPGAFGCNPPTTDGFSIWRNGPETDPAPRLAVSHGLGAVPVWFVGGSSLDAAIANDGALTMAELRALAADGRVLIGSADYFHEVLQPHDAAPVPMTQFVARGSLQDGRSFRVHGLFVEGTTIQTDIDIGSA